MNKPWSVIDDEELRLLRELETICRRSFQNDPYGKIYVHSGGIPDRIHHVLDELKRVRK